MLAMEFRSWREGGRTILIVPSQELEAKVSLATKFQ
jgi:hypothetical protein